MRRGRNGVRVDYLLLALLLPAVLARVIDMSPLTLDPAVAAVVVATRST